MASNRNKAPDPTKKALPVKAINRKTGKVDSTKTMVLTHNNRLTGIMSDSGYFARSDKEQNRKSYKRNSAKARARKASAVGNDTSRSIAMSYKAANKVIDRQKMPKGGRGVRGKGK